MTFSDSMRIRDEWESLDLKEETNYQDIQKGKDGPGQAKCNQNKENQKKTEENRGNKKKHKTKRKLKDDDTCVVKEFNFMFRISMFSQFAWSTQDNGVHASAGPLEALRERMVPAGTGRCGLLQWCYMWGNKNKIIIK